MKAALWHFLRMSLCVAVLSALAAACTPALDWRDVRNTDAGYRALFPSKPAMASRPFVIAGESVTLRLHATTVNGAYFAVGEIPLSEAQQAQAPAILEALKTARRNNVGAERAEPERLVSIRGTQWQDVRATGKMANGQASVLAGRFLIQPGRILEVLAMGERAQLSDETIETWLNSVVLEPRP